MVEIKVSINPVHFSLSLRIYAFFPIAKLRNNFEYAKEKFSKVARKILNLGVQSGKFRYDNEDFLINKNILRDKVTRYKVQRTKDKFYS